MTICVRLKLIAATLVAFSALAVLPARAQSNFTATVSPQPISLSRGGGSQTATVTTSAVSMNIRSITYSFDRVPAGVSYAPASAVTADPGFPPVSFSFTAATAAAAGTYPVLLQAVPFCGTLCPPGVGPQSIPVTLVVQQGDINVMFAQNPTSVCPSGPAVSNSVLLQPMNGYAGTPSVSFEGVPAGIVVSPSTLSSPSLERGPATLPFTVQASAPAGNYLVTLRVIDREAGIDRSVPLQIVVSASDYTPSIAPGEVTLIAGGSAENVAVSLTATACFNDSVSVTTTVPAGLRATPSSLMLAPPYAPASVALHAPAGTPAGTYEVTFSYVSSRGASRNATVRVRVSPAADYELRVSPGAISLLPGQSRSVEVCLATFHGLAGSVAVTAPAHPGLTFSPSTFALGEGGCRSVLVAAASNMTSQTVTLAFQGSHSSAGLRTAPLTIIVSATPDFAVVATPPLLVLAGDTSGTVNITATAVNGFTGAVSVVIGAAPGISFTPASFSLSPGATQPVTVTPSLGTPPGTTRITVTGQGSGVAEPRTTTFDVTVIATPDFLLQTEPTTLSLAPGESRDLTISATAINGFNGVVNVTASTPGIALISPSSFQLTPGGSQRVTVTVPPATPAGGFQIIFSGTAPGVSSTRSASVVVQVTAVAADFSLRVSPAATTIAHGESGPIAVSVLFGDGTSHPVQVTATAPAGLSVAPTSLTFNGAGTQTALVSVAAGAQPGQHVVVFAAQGAGMTRTAQAVVTVPQRDYALVLTPATLSIAAGQSSTVLVALSGTSGIDAVDVVAATASGLSVTPSSFRVTAGMPVTVVVTAAHDASVGSRAVTFTGSASGITRVATLSVQTLPRNPAIRAVSPPSISVASRSAVVLLTGTDFAAGATVTSARPGMVIESARLVAPTAAEVVITFRGEAIPGRYPLTLRNPDGGTSTEDVALLVYPADALGAPVGVTTAAIVFPAGGTFVAEDEAVYARGLLATTGTGTIFGQWQLDGVPFDVFTATVSGGMPTEIRSHVPIPARTSGPHRLELVVRSPQYAISPSVTVVQTVDTASRLTLLAPGDGSVVADGQTFRWSLVPGASGYEIEVDHTEEVLPRMIRVSDAEWTLTPFEARRLGTGVRRWRVRPVLGGETRGEPTRWSRFVVLPERVLLNVLPPRLEPSTSRHHVRWTGGYPGLLYQVEFVEADGNVAFRALTNHPEYVLPTGSSERLQQLSVRVTPLGPNGGSVGESNEAPMPVSRGTANRPYVFVNAAEVARVVRQQPVDGASVTSSLPLLRAEWSVAVDPDSVAIVVDDVDVTAVSDITPTSIRHQTLLPLAPGPHRVRVTATSVVSEWHFTVAEPTSAGSDPARAAGQRADESVADAPSAVESERRGTVRHDWTAMPIGSVAATSGPAAKNEARAQISGQADIAMIDQRGSAKFSGDLSLARQLEQPNETLSSNRNWLTRFGAKQPWVSEDVVIGYNIPSIFDQAQLLTLGLARGGAVGTVATRAGSLSYYEAFDSNAGAATTFFNPRQDVRAFAYETPFNRDRALIRLVRLDTEEESGTFTSGGSGRSLGLFTRFAFGRATTLIIEAARGEFTPLAESVEQAREGDALSVRLDGYLGRLAYRAHLRGTEATFVNPANRGLTPASVADRRGADFSLMRIFGTSVVTADVRYLTGANSSGASSTDAREEGGKLSLANFSLGRRFTLGGSVNLTNSRAGEILIYGLPATDRTLRGGEMTIATSGRMQISQSLSYQQTADNITPLNGSTMTNLTFAVNGMPSRTITLSAIASGIRSEPENPAAGRTDMLVVSINPAIAIPGASLSLRPSVTYSRSENSAYEAFASESTSYGAGINWSPEWFGNILSLQVSSNWSEIKSGTIRTEIDPTYSATLTLRKAVGRGPAVPNGTTLPGASPISVPEAATTNPIQGTTPATTNPK